MYQDQLEVHDVYVNSLIGGGENVMNYYIAWKWSLMIWNQK